MDLLLPLQAILGVFALTLLYHLLIAKSKGAKCKEAPEVAGAWPVIGHLHMLGGHEQLAVKLGAMADKYGPAFMLRVGVHPTLVVSGWEIAKECFTTNDKVLATRPSSMAGEYMSYNYAMFGMAPYGPYWREMRKVAMLELLSNHRLEKSKHIQAAEIGTCVKELYGLWVESHQDSAKVRMDHWFGDLVFNVVVRMVVGKRYFGTACVGDDGEARIFQKAIYRWFYLAGVSVVSDALPVLKWMDLQGYKRQMEKTLRELNSLALIWLEEHRRNRVGRGGEGDQDFMDVMLSIQSDQDSHGDHDTTIKATSLTLILAGADTTAVTLTWAVSLLLNNSFALKKARDELDAHIGKERQVDESDIKNLVYLQAIVKETLRLYPAGPLALPHEAMEDCQIGGFNIPAGTRLLVNLWKLQRDPSVWVDPSEFRPERFLTSHVDVDVRGQHFQYIPFGSGRRSCPGISLALQVVHLTLARLLHGFCIEASGGVPVDMTEGVGLTMPKATPLEVLISPRLPSELY
eukprot:TRINITY_DN16017_c0_g1_i1.p1 TRINITY_DN16017_c0_g1~~TRINITY_DN16017_c0_g1_i1.p1  ORF type:complete len:517 (+),score=39.99 TRINITY_DN16017_c0_g1_i1:202-1752(+)